MTGVPASLTGRAVGYFAIREFIPLYGVYALLFLDSGLTTGEVSTLLVIWSVTSFVFEVPSGTWADIVSRRALLVLSSLIYAAGFTSWIVFPTYAGFAAGFVLWGVSGALMSGTFEALLYDELAARGATSTYARVMGWANSLAMVATLAGTALATPLYAVGGYPLVGAFSVVIALVQAGLAWSLPSAPKVAEADGTASADADAAPGPAVSPGVVGRYLSMLRSGAGDVARVAVVRQAVLVVALLMGFLAFDEFFPVVAREGGADTSRIPLLMAVTFLGQAIGTALAGRTARMRGAAMAGAVVAAAVLVAVGVLTSGAGSVPAQWIGFAAVGAGYGLAHNAIIVAEARLQDAITGPARATVTSFSGLLSEIVAVSVFAAFALGSAWFAVTAMVVALTIPLAAVAALIPRWLPPPARIGG